MQTIQERIKERRSALGLTLLEIAEALGVKEATVQRYESGEIKNIKHETIVALAEILCCSPQYLMGWTDSVIDEPQDEKTELLEAVRERPELRLLFDTAKTAKTEDIKRAVKILEALKGE